MINNITYQTKSINAVDCISKGWNIAGQNYVLFIGIVFFGGLLGSCIPIISVFLYGPITVGIYYAFLRQIKGEKADLNMLFKGFNNFIPAMLAGIIVSIPSIIGRLVEVCIRLLRIFEIIKPEDLENFFTTKVIIFLSIVGLIFFIIGFAISISVFFVFPLIAEFNLGVIDALKLSFKAGWSNVGGLIILGIFELLIGFIGILACLIGVFFTTPIIIAANTIAYKQVFPDFKVTTPDTSMPTI